MPEATGRLATLLAESKKIPGVVALDADTAKDKEGSVRFENLWAPETQKFTEEGLKHGEWGGEFLKELYTDLALETGYTDLVRTGKTGKYGRDLGYRSEKGNKQNNYTNRLVYEGLANPSTESQKELYDMGVFTRAHNQAFGEVDSENPWEVARQKKYQYERDTDIGLKKVAYSEDYLAGAADYYGKTYSPYVSDQVMVRHGDRNIFNEANSNWRTGWATGWGSIKESSAEAISVIGDLMDNDWLYNVGQGKAMYIADQNSELPRFANDIMNVDSLGSLGDYIAGMAGVAAPYMLGIMGAAVAGAAAVTFGAPALAGGVISLIPGFWVYSGETYGNMTGDMDQKNAAIAMSGGAAMTLLDRLGLAAIMKPSQALKKNGLEQVAKHYAKETGVTIEAARIKVRNEAGDISRNVIKDVANFADLQLSKALLAKDVAGGFLKGAAIESVTEGMQESIGYGFGAWGSPAEFNEAEYKHILANALAGGAILGGGISGVTTATSTLGGFKRLQNDLSPNYENKDYVGGTYEENLQELIDGIEFTGPMFPVDGPETPVQTNRDVVKETEEEYKKGEKADVASFRGGDKTLYQAAKDFRKRLVQKTGSYWWNKIMDNPNMSTKAKKAFATIASVAGHGKKSLMQGLDLGRTKSILMQGMIAEVDQLQSDLYTLTGVGVTGISRKDARKIFTDHLNRRMNGKEVNPEHKNIEAELDELKDRIGGQDINSEGITDNLLNAVNNLTGDIKTKKKLGWFQKSARLDTQAVSKDKKGFIKALQDNGWTKTDSESFWDIIVNGPAGYDKTTLDALGFKNFQAKSLKQSRGVLHDVFGEDSKFLENNPFQRLRENIQEQVNYAADLKYLGENMSNVKKLLAVLKDEMGDEWDPRLAYHFMDSISASRGDYKRMHSKRLERLVGHLTWFNTFAHLSLSTVASLPESAIVLIGATKDKSILELIKTGVSDLGSHYKMHGKDAWSYINPKSGVTRDEYIQNVVDFYRYGYGTGKHGAIGQVGIDEAVYKTSKIKERFMKAFFFANGLKLYTDATRIARLSLANDAIFGDLEIIYENPPGSPARDTGLVQDAFGRIRELNVDPDRLAESYNTVYKKAVDLIGINNIMELTPEDLYATLISIDKDFMNTMDIARVTWVDNAIAHPDAMNRPLFYSNPHYRLFTQYNGFMSVFTAHILPKIWQSIKKSDPTARYNAVAIGATMLAMGFLSQILKDEWKYDGTPGWITEKGYIQRGVASSGLLGTPERLLEAISPLYEVGHQSTTDRVIDATEGFLGPTVQHGQNISKIFLNMIEGNDIMRNKYLAKEIPILGSEKGFKDWFIEQAK